MLFHNGVYIHVWLVVWLQVMPSVNCFSCRYFLRCSDVCRFPVWFYSPVKKKSSSVLGVPVAAATHICKDKATAVELGLPLVAAKKSSYTEHLVPRERYCICMCHIFMFKVLHSCSFNTFLWPHFPLTYHFLALFQYIFPCVCAKPVCFYPRSQEDCAWVRTVIYLYSTVYLSTILNFVVTKWTSCAVYGAVLSHIVSNLCVHYWFVIVGSVIKSISYLMTFPQTG